MHYFVSVKPLEWFNFQVGCHTSSLYKVSWVLYQCIVKNVS